MIQPAAPQVELAHLDTLWFQVAGTICNLRCTHCFISCAPDNHRYGFMPFEEVERWLEEARGWGVKEYYLTGGEPFMNRDLPRIVAALLERGPTSILTNGTLLPDRMIRPIAKSARDSRYSLEIRVSIDGPDAETNDPIRGDGMFDRAMEGVQILLDHGFLPIITATQVWDPERDEEVRQAFVRRLLDVGYRNPRLKILPSLKLGREAERVRAYTPDERVTPEMLDGYAQEQLICASSRVITTDGVHVCPILLDAPDARLGDTLDEAAGPFALSHRACFTCWLHGAICSNFGGIADDVA